MEDVLDFNKINETDGVSLLSSLTVEVPCYRFSKFFM